MSDHAKALIAGASLLALVAMPFVEWTWSPALSFRGFLGSVARVAFIKAILRLLTDTLSRIILSDRNSSPREALWSIGYLPCGFYGKSSAARTYRYGCAP